jgi:BirA family biotin operon repressor/biotin-[acetyl-CoA-carboxylase] ligase
MIGKCIYYVTVCDNSMEWAKSLLSQAPHGALLLAREHRSTRGRQGRDWQRMPGQLLLTFILKPSLINDANKVHLVMATSLGFLEPLKTYGVGFKWPNDLVCGGKKVGGILIETVWHGEKLGGVIAAIGLNVNTIFTEDNPLYSRATSLYHITGEQQPEYLVQGAMCDSLQKYYDRFSQGDYAALYNEWRREQVYLGKVITVHRYDAQEITGIILDITALGDIVLMTSDNSLQTVTFAEAMDIKPLSDTDLQTEER